MNRHPFLFAISVLLIVFNAQGHFPRAHAGNVVRVCVYSNYPVIYYDGDNTPRGVFIDILESIAKRENWALDYKICTWSECLSGLDNHTVDLVPAIAYSPQRAERYEFNRETVVTNYGVVFVMKNAGINSILDLQDKAVGVLRGDIHYEALEKLLGDFGVTCRFVEAPTYDAIEALFHDETIQAGLFNRLHSIKTTFAASVVQSPIVLNPLEMRFASFKGSRELIAKIDGRLSEMKKNRGSVYHTAMDQWLMVEPIHFIPEKLYWFSGAAGLALLIVFLFNFLLRREVHAKTREITRQHDNLASAIRTRKAVEKRLQTILENAPVVIWAIDTDGAITFSEGRCLDLLGLTDAEAIGHSLFDIYADSPGILNDIRRALNGEVVESIAAVKNKYFDIHYVPDKNEKGELIGAIGFGLDVTQNTMAQKRVRDSEALFRTAFRTHPDSININRLHDGIYIDINDGFTQLTGYSRDEAIGRSSLDINIWNDPTDRQKLVRGLTQSGRVNNIEAQFRLKDGRVKTGLMSAAVIQLHGEPHILSVTRNIEDRKQVEQRLRMSEERFRLAFDHAAVGRAIARPEGPLIQVNSSFAAILGMTRDELLSKTWQEITHPEFIDDARRLIERLVRDELPAMNLELRMIHNQGHGVWVRLNCVLVRGQDGEPLYLVGDIEDITDTKEMERRLIQSQKMEAIGSLAGGIAHDFNNLLSPIIGYAELLLSDLPAGSEAHANIGRIHSAGKRAGDLVRQILTFSRSTDAEIKPLRISPIIKEVIQLVRSTIPATIEIRHAIDSQCAMVMADPTQIHQVAMNLITNAYHAMRATGGEMDVRLDNCTIQAQESVGLPLSPGEYVCMTVADTGHGMDSETLSKIFDPYFTTKERGEGTGLGLAVVHGIVKKFGGDVKVTSEIGKGSVFGIYLPAIAADSRIHPVGDERFAAGGNEHILVVDDEETLVELERSMLERMGYRITTRISSVEALNAFKNAPDRYDLVITDMTMPKMTGLALSHELKRIRKDIRIILCTGFSEQVGKDTANQNHIDGFIMKPVVMSELSAVVRGVLNG